MARTKYFPPARPSQGAKPKSPPPTVKALWMAVIELGASNGQAMVKKPGGEWELVRWAQGVSASSVGGAEAIPAMTAICKSGQSTEILHGHAAVRARKRNPGAWEMFAYPKLVFTDEGITPNIQQTLDLQKEKASALGMTSKEIAIAFFRHMISEVIGVRDETFKVYMNISDRWPNRNVQELMLSLESVRPDAQFEHVDECLSSIVGRISSNAGSGPAEGVYVVIDYGHSGMNVGFAKVTAEPRYEILRKKDYPAGAGEINMAVEDAVRSINRTNGAKAAEANVWEVSECIDEYFKPEPAATISPRCGLSDEEWDRVIGHAELALRSLDRRRPELARPTLKDALDLTNRMAGDIGLHVLLTGRGLRSPPSLKALRELVCREFPIASVHEDKQTNITAVLAGLAFIADNPEVLSVKEAPVSLWLRSDPDESINEEGHDTVVRICTQGKDKDDTVHLRDRVSASHPIHFELSTTDDEPPSLDLSVFGTPARVSDEDIIQGWNADEFAYTSVDKVTEFGRFEHQLARSTVKPGNKACHVYLYMELSRLSVAFYAIFAKDGRAVKPLEKVPFDRALQNGELTTKWKKYQNIELDMVRLRQVARPETLSASSLEHSAAQVDQRNNPEGSLARGSQSSQSSHAQDPSYSENQQSGAQDSDVSPENSSTVQQNEADDRGSGRKRTLSLLKSGKRKRHGISSISSLAAKRKGKASDGVQSEGNSTDDMGTESEIEM